MQPLPLLTIYCVLILLASLAGGWLPMIIRLTHRRLELAVSLVSGVMLGIALLHLLPHAIAERAAHLATAGGGHDHAHAHDHVAAAPHLDHGLLEPVMLWLLLGFLVIFMVERFFCFHHHDAPAAVDPAARKQPGDELAPSSATNEPASGDHDHGHHHDAGHQHEQQHRHRLTWTGALIGFAVHSIIAGVALGASVLAAAVDGTATAALPGFGTFLAIVLHKPFDSMTIGTLMAAGGRPVASRHLVNGLFALSIPIGVVLLYLGAADSTTAHHQVVSAALAFSAGMFLCIALSDLLPELQFHQHDRAKLTIALLLGLAIAWGASRMEHAGHEGVSEAVGERQ